VDALIELRNIIKDYGALRALDDISLQVGPGITGLLGPNGAGKTTLIKVIFGLVRIRRGSGRVLGLPLGKQTRDIRAAIGYMPEDDCYLPGLSGVEMLQLAARLSGLPATEALRRSHEILDFCAVEQERYRNVETYSTGMRQKLKFAQAIVHDPPMLILDEPTAGLDPEEREAMLSRIRLLAARAGKAIVLSTHILPDVQNTCQHVVIMARGRIRVTEQLAVLNQPRLPTLQLEVLGNAASLAERLRRRGFQVTQRETGTLAVEGPSIAASETIWQCARDAEVGLRTITPAQNSLEHIFLEAVGEQDHAHP